MRVRRSRSVWIPPATVNAAATASAYSKPPTDANGGTTRLVDSGVAGAPSLVWVGTWNDSATSVFYANATDSRLYRATPSAGAVLVSDEVKAAAVAGAADVAGDGARELV